MTGMTYSTSNVFFLPLITSISITNAYNFTLDSFLRLLAMLNLVQKESDQDQANMFRGTYFNIICRFV